jgi:hypothetical protein
MLAATTKGSAEERTVTERSVLTSGRRLAQAALAAYGRAASETGLKTSGGRHCNPVSFMTTPKTETRSTNQKPREDDNLSVDQPGTIHVTFIVDSLNQSREDLQALDSVLETGWNPRNEGWRTFAKSFCAIHARPCRPSLKTTGPLPGRT